MQLSRTTLAVIGAAALALVITTGVVLAAGPRTATGTTPVAPVTGTYGAGAGAGGYGQGAGPNGVSGTAARGTALIDVSTLASGTLTDAQRAILVQMVEEEKLALDLYTAFSTQYATPVWSNIARSESTHLAAVRALLAKYGIADPTITLAAGDYATPAVDAMYATLLAQGQASESAAWAVGRAVELDDIAKLDAAAAGVTATDVTTVYASLRAASVSHLAAFDRQLAR